MIPFSVAHPLPELLHWARIISLLHLNEKGDSPCKLVCPRYISPTEDVICNLPSRRFGECTALISTAPEEGRALTRHRLSLHHVALKWLYVTVSQWRNFKDNRLRTLTNFFCNTLFPFAPPSRLQHLALWLVSLSHGLSRAADEEFITCEGILLMTLSAVRSP